MIAATTHPDDHLIEWGARFDYVGTVELYRLSSWPVRGLRTCETCNPAHAEALIVTGGVLVWHVVRPTSAAITKNVARVLALGSETDAASAAFQLGRDLGRWNRHAARSRCSAFATTTGEQCRNHADDGGRCYAHRLQVEP